MGISDLMVKAADLAEAEGRLAKRAVFKLAVALVLLTVVAGVLLTAVGLLIAAGYVALRRVMPVDGALLVLGVLLVILAGLIFGWAKSMGEGSE